MSNVSLFKPQSHWSNKSLMFWWFSCEILANKTNLINSSFPAFSFSLSWTDNFKHFSFSHRLDFFNRNIPFSSFFFSFLLDHIGQHFWVFLLLSIHQICWNCTILYWLSFRFGIFLFMSLNSFFHLNFLFKSFFIEYFGLDASQCLCFFRYNFSSTSLFLSAFFLCIQTLTKSLLMKLHIIVLRHFFLLCALLKIIIYFWTIDDYTIF